MTCTLCKKRIKGSSPADRCAFVGGLFQRDNWNCATMNKLRSVADSLGTTWREDLTSRSIGYVPFGSPERNGNIVMTWHKDHVITGNAVIMIDAQDPQPLTEDVAAEAIKWQKQMIKKHYIFD